MELKKGQTLYSGGKKITGKVPEKVAAEFEKGRVKKEEKEEKKEAKKK